MKTIVVALLLVLPSAAGAQQSEPARGIGYPSVAAALDALKARSDVRIENQGGWIIVTDRKDSTLWSFTPPGHAAHPAAVKRAILQQDGAIYVQMRILCQADKAPCDKLVADFEALNEQMKAEIQKSKQGR